MAKTTLGVIYGNRDFFPDHLVKEARSDMGKVFRDLNVKPIQLTEKDTKLGGVETYADAKKCADLLRRHREEIGGVLVCLPNFGDEKGVSETLRLSELDVPILVQAYPDELDNLNVERRRDAFCGKISVCNNLFQRQVPYTLTNCHVVHPFDVDFEEDLKEFIAICRTVKGLRRARLGAIGARPGAFNTVRYSEKILEAAGISVTTVDFSEIMGSADRLDAKAASVKRKLKAIQDYAKAPGVPEEKLVRMAKLDVVISDWMQTNELDASAIQCWTSIQQNYGINVCTLMSMMSQKMMPSACEVDVTGVLAMYALQLASGAPSALVDWNNNYGSEPDKCVLFHCGNWAKCFLPDIQIATAPILGTTVGVENTCGALEGRAPAGPLTFGRVTTDDTTGSIRAYVGEGRLTDDKLKTFGSRAVAEIPDLEGLMHHVCAYGFEHHVAMNASHCARVVAEAFENYLGWETYYHVGMHDHSGSNHD
ncbi:L-fucose/L-arabinose isomerase family protein [Candidatus Sumerlaeota bacterium]|nr:L-fucose/L-arabinose isomerase family protein [Candidatus Sumerlaeota bacterium]